VTAAFVDAFSTGVMATWQLVTADCCLRIEHCLGVVAGWKKKLRERAGNHFETSLKRV